MKAELAVRHLYHGSDRPSSRLSVSDRGLFGPGTYLTDCSLDASQYTESDSVMTVLAQLERPFYTRADYSEGEAIDFDTPAVPFVRELFGDKAHSIIERARCGDGYFGREVYDELVSLGHDSVVITWPDGLTHVLALHSGQLTVTGRAKLDERGNVEPVKPISGARLRSWLGKSQLVDRAGNPLVLYHGSRSLIDTFQAGVSHQGRPSCIDDRRLYFTPNPELASQYAGEGGAVYPVHVRLENPMPYTVRNGGNPRGRGGYRREALFPGGFTGSGDDIRLALKHGYDGILIGDEVQVFCVSQILSAFQAPGFPSAKKRYNPGESEGPCP